MEDRQTTQSLIQAPQGSSTNYLFDDCKLLWHMDRVHEYYRDGHRIHPLHIDIGATKACNARCIYCYGVFQKMTNEVIPAKPLCNLFRDAPRLGIKSITITGDGEPALNPAIYDAISIGKKNGLDIAFATNGIFLDYKKIENILSTCTTLRFNLSAIGEEGYKSIHGVPQWQRVQANIQLAVQIKRSKSYECSIGLQMVLVPQAQAFIIPESRWAVDNSVDFFVIKQFSDPNCTEIAQFDQSWYRNKGIQIKLREAERLSNNITKIIPKWKTMAREGRRPYNHCVDCALLFQISGNSKCYPCGYLFNDERYCYGDLKKQSLKEILSSERYWNIIHHMRHKFDVHKDCEGSCRHDASNSFIWNYTHPPTHVNFI